jgi:hypothetical protein
MGGEGVMLYVIYGSDRSKALFRAFMDHIKAGRSVDAMDPVAYLDTRQKWYPKSGDEFMERLDNPRFLIRLHGNVEAQPSLEHPLGI